MPEKPNSRDFTRIKVKVRARLKTHQGIMIQGNAKDLSVNGVYIASESRLPMGTECEVSLLLDGDDDALPITVMGQIARMDDHGIAIEFNSIDTESLEHLHNLILYNASDADEVEQEMEDSVGLHRLKPPTF